MKKQDRVITISIDAELLKATKDKATKEERSTSQIIRLALVQYLKGGN